MDPSLRTMESKQNDSNGLESFFAPGLFKRHRTKIYFSLIGEYGEGEKSREKSRNIQPKYASVALSQKGNPTQNLPTNLHGQILIQPDGQPLGSAYS